MKLDEIDDTTSQVNIVSKKKSTPVSQSGNVNSILDMLNPLKSININSDLHSFYSFRESKESVEALLKAQTNLVFYVIHQNFMCDAVHKDFFKNMVGRFYDLPERFWGYYRGINYFSDNKKESINGLVLVENAQLYFRAIKGDHAFIEYEFKAVNSKTLDVIVFNNLALKHLHGLTDVEYDYARDFFPFNTNFKNSSFSGHYHFLKVYETYRFQNNINNDSISGYWDIFTTDNILKKLYSKGEYPIFSSRSLYASFGIDNPDHLIETINNEYVKKGKCFDKIKDWPEDDIKMIRSLSQTFNWTKEYILQNEEKLDLDVLGLNMTVPWDLDLVKFFIKRGYGGRMSENKAVFDRVFKPLLTDEILDMLFRLEYEKY